MQLPTAVRVFLHQKHFIPARTSALLLEESTAEGNWLTYGEVYYVLDPMCACTTDRTQTFYNDALAI